MVESPPIKKIQIKIIFFLFFLKKIFFDFEKKKHKSNKRNKRKMAASTDYIKPHVVFVLVGLPGAGKSYFARKLSEPYEDGSIPNVVTLCQGTMARDEYNMLVEQTIHRKVVDDGKAVIDDPQQLPHVIIDRCNSTPKDREFFVNIANRRLVEHDGKTVPRRIICLVWFDFTESFCQNLLKRRVEHGEDHPTVHDMETAHKAMCTHKKIFKPPTKHEIHESSGDRFIRISSVEQEKKFIERARKWL